MTRCYVNGKRVTKEELGKIEIRDEVINRILLDKFRKKKGDKEKCKAECKVV